LYGYYQKEDLKKIDLLLNLYPEEESLRFRRNLSNLKTIQQVCDVFLTIDHYKTSKIPSLDAGSVINLVFLGLRLVSTHTECSFRKGSANSYDERYLVFKSLH
jgi:hypothetical protein